MIGLANMMAELAIKRAGYNGFGRPSKAKAEGYRPMSREDAEGVFMHADIPCTREYYAILDRLDRGEPA